MIPQNINLVDASIKENISLGIEPEKIDAHRIKKVIKEACLDSFIETLIYQKKKIRSSDSCIEILPSSLEKMAPDFQAVKDKD